MFILIIVYVNGHSRKGKKLFGWLKSGGYQSDPLDIAALARRFPDVKIIMAHLSGAGIKGILKIKLNHFLMFGLIPQVLNIFQE